MTWLSNAHNFPSVRTKSDQLAALYNVFDSYIEEKDPTGDWDLDLPEYEEHLLVIAYPAVNLNYWNRVVIPGLKEIAECRSCVVCIISPIWDAYGPKLVLPRILEIEICPPLCLTTP